MQEKGRVATFEFTTPVQVNIFDAKRVPVDYMDRISDFREFQRLGWASVVDTVNREETLEDFDYYFDFLVDKVIPLLQSP